MAGKQRKRLSTKLIYGVGKDDCPYTPQVRSRNEDGVYRVNWSCPFFTSWKNMLMRCYNLKYQERRPAYKDCIVCEEWLTFSNFKSWMEEQEWEGRQLDKDILGDGKLYSPETCIFISTRVNSFLLDCGSADKRGYSYHTTDGVRYSVSVSDPFTKKPRKKHAILTSEEATKQWKLWKLELLDQLVKEEGLPVDVFCNIKNSIESVGL